MAQQLDSIPGTKHLFLICIGLYDGKNVTNPLGVQQNISASKRGRLTE
jgi:hypothetical protein